MVLDCDHVLYNKPSKEFADTVNVGERKLRMLYRDCEQVFQSDMTEVWFGLDEYE